MKAVTYAALLMGVLSTALGQKTLGPSPTESIGCVPHGDHWDCEGPRVTADVTTGTGPAVTTAPATTPAHHDDDHDHDHDHDHSDSDDEHDHHSGTESLKPSPTESYGCEPHGDHWHCEGHVTASSTLFTTTTSTSASADAASTSSSAVSTAGAAQATGLGIAGLMAVVAMAL
ncbi:hypothetical protein QBC38DRAFT_201489 [Podospora fimiseda]|uniref:GPI anchored protein n=1 Tax=Podospora fimiseda TaxID=252190 RepID=A0AAN7BY35_9PEZI|nr:hypothetical protein QBC38DRAFT_201489 [Podospora fimiseda]